MSITHAQAAKVMGMKEREVAGVQPRAGGGFVVTTFEGARTELLPTGQTAPVVPPAKAAKAAQAPAETTSAPPKPAKATPAKRQRGKKGEPADPPPEQPADVYPAEDAESDRLAWVGTDPARVVAALEYETGVDTTPDQAIIAKLEALAAAYVKLDATG